jgi:hypothetical protein
MFRARKKIQKAIDRTVFSSVILMCIKIKGNYPSLISAVSLKKV